jgi:YebC/PmpR family DNA-binding regulatory protein
MSGHSKWSKIKHQKGVTDVVKGKIFTKLANAIIVSVKQGGGITDPEMNYKLRLAIEKAKAMNVPKENIERAIEKGKGTGPGQEMHEVIYEAYGPKGVGIIIEATTNNKQRTVADIKNLLDKGGGVLAASGAVSYLFDLVGMLEVSKNGKTYDEIMEIALNSEAEDLSDNGNFVDIYTNHSDLHKVKEKISKLLDVSSFELVYRPKNLVRISEKADADKILKLLSVLEENEDVQKVHANFDMPDEFISA